MNDIKLWIIEDNEFFRLTIKDLLYESGRFLQIIGFSSCEDALQIIGKENPPDVILLDISLPGMNGIEGISHFKAYLQNTYIIVLTVHDDNDNIFNSLAAGASGYILKTSTKEKILESIEEVMNGGAPMTSKIAKQVLELFSSLHKPSNEYNLSDREKEVLYLLVEGKTKKQIADFLFLSYHTIDNHIRSIYNKLSVQSRTAAVAKALQEKI